MGVWLFWDRISFLCQLVIIEQWDSFLQVVLVANSLPALNDVTAMELPDIVAEAAKVCPFEYFYAIDLSLFLRCPI